MVNADLIQRVKVGFIFIIQFYKVTTGTLMSLFIPQSCGDHVCSIGENYNNNEIYHKCVFYCNCFSMFTFYMYYIIELRREEWAIKYLDIDNDKSDNGLKEIIINEPILNIKMDKLNNIYYKTLIFNCIVYFINLSLTIKLLKDKYYNNSTISCFISFTLLVLIKLYNSLIVARESIKNDKMMSSFMSEFVSFNVLDADYLEDKQKKEELQTEDIIPIINP